MSRVETFTANTSASALVPQFGLQTIADARAAALARMTEAAAALAGAFSLTQAAANIAKTAHGGHAAYRDSRRETTHIENLFGAHFDADASLAAWRTQLDAGIWTRLLHETRLHSVMDRTERDTFEAALRGDVPEATLENMVATLSRLTGDADLMFKRGLARCFSDLDRRFKSHDAFKIGSRIILTRVFDEWGYWHCRSYSSTVADIERVFAILDGKAPNPGALEAAIRHARGGAHGARQSEVETEYFTARAFKNGNLHLWFSRPELVTKANLVLADYYGAAVADAATEDDTPDIIRKRSQVPAKDLAFYPTPAAVVDELLRSLHLKPGMRVLEPSAGIGNIVRPLLAKGCIVEAIEIHPDRARALESIAHPNLTVRLANFLKVEAHPVFDAVLANPPFAGTHWIAHVVHAWNFVAPGGKLSVILPASAEVNETPRHIEFRQWAERVDAARYGRRWTALPAESFASVGTNIQTVILTLHKAS
ncbi:MAG: DUF4942 domain-containing protein [Paracoccaceae bacterium]|nr:DUF4942 domain-containing protein [Paracoccaceae bacterium]